MVMAFMTLVMCCGAIHAALGQNVRAKAISRELLERSWTVERWRLSVSMLYDPTTPSGQYGEAEWRASNNAVAELLDHSLKYNDASRGRFHKPILQAFGVDTYGVSTLMMGSALIFAACTFASASATVLKWRDRRVNLYTIGAIGVLAIAGIVLYVLSSV